MCPAGSRWGGVGSPAGSGASTTPQLLVFKEHRDVALGDIVSGHGGSGLVLGLGVLEVFSNPNDPMFFFF